MASSKTVDYGTFQKMVKNLPPNSSVTPEALAKGILGKGFTLGQGLEKYMPDQPKPPTQSSWMQSLAGGVKNVYDFVASPVHAAAGAIGSVAGNVAGALGADGLQNALQATPVVKDLKDNVSQSADALPFLGGIAGSFAGPLGTGFGTGVGKAAKHALKQSVGEESNSLSALPGQMLDTAATTGMAVATDAALRAAPQAIKQTLAGRGAEKRAAKDIFLQQLVQPKASSSLIQETGAKNPELVKSAFLRDTKLLATEQEKALAETAKTIQGFGKSSNVYENAKMVKQTIAGESQELLKAFEANNGLLPPHEVTGKVIKNVTEAAKDFGEQGGIFQSTADIWKRISNEYPGTIAGQWQARQAFDDELISRFGVKIFEKGSARAVAVKAVRQAVNETIEQGATRAGLSFAPQMQRLSHMYDIMENLSTKMGKTAAAKRILNTPLGRTVAGTAVGAIGLKTFQSFSQ